MKNLFIIFTVLMFVSTVFSQQVELVSVPKDMLTADQKAKLELKKQATVVKEYVGIGREIGDGATAIFDALNKNAVEFGESTPGIILIGILAWHIMGADFIQAIIGFFIWIMGTLLFSYSFKKSCVPSV